MKYILLSILIFSSSQLFAFECAEKYNQNSVCHQISSPQEIKAIIKALIYSENSQLEKIDRASEYNLNGELSSLASAYENKRIKIREFTNDQYFLKTMFKLTHIFKRKKTMFIDINKKIYNCGPSKSALISIIMHELKHLVDYQNSNILKFIKLGLKMSNKKGRSRYERDTDLFVLKNNLGNGLKEYRHWIYEKLTPKQLRTKMCYYYTPYEIDQYLIYQQSASSGYFNQYCR